VAASASSPRRSRDDIVHDRPDALMRASVGVSEPSIEDRADIIGQVALTGSVLVSLMSALGKARHQPHNGVKPNYPGAHDNRCGAV
jgi:hypothetical protein